VTVTISPGNQVIDLLDTGVAPDEDPGDGIFTATWTPLQTGDYDLEFQGHTASSNSPLETCSGSVLEDLHYYLQQVPFTWEDAATGGTFLIDGEDDFTVEDHAIGFDFPFYGKIYTEVSISPTE